MVRHDYPNRPAYYPGDEGRLVKNMRILQMNGARQSWAPGGDFIAFDRAHEDNLYDVYIMTAEGRIVASLTDGNPTLPQRHNGNPAWHPSGEFILFQSEAESHFALEDLWTPDPGYGNYANFWAMTKDGKHVWQLTDIPIKQAKEDAVPIYGCVNAHFSPDGKQVVWTEGVRVPGKQTYMLKLADFVLGTDGPRLENVRQLPVPKGREGTIMISMAFSPDGSRILFAGNLDGQRYYALDQYVYDLASGEAANLTNQPALWQEDSSWSPDGQHIVFMSNAGFNPFDAQGPDWTQQPRIREYWMMDPDGGNKVQLTYFNTPGAPEYMGRRFICCHNQWSPDGTKLVGLCGLDYGNEKRANIKGLSIVLLEFR